MKRVKKVSREIPDYLMNPRCRRKKVFLLFHWAPKSRRRSILKHGLKIGMKQACHSKGWRANYLCFSDWPVYAWTYSAGTTWVRQEWDLWVVRSDCVGRITYRFDMKGQQPAELRTWQDIPPESIAYVATREHRPRRTRKA